VLLSVGKESFTVGFVVTKPAATFLLRFYHRILCSAAGSTILECSGEDSQQGRTSSLAGIGKELESVSHWYHSQHHHSFQCLAKHVSARCRSAMLFWYSPSGLTPDCQPKDGTSAGLTSRLL
jgi:hypothetical protein